MALIMPEEPGTLLLHKTYMAFLVGATENNGTAMFRHLYMLQNGQEVDVIENGELACALFASGILVLCELGTQLHTWVSEVEKDALASGWFASSADTKPGALLFWPERVTRSGSRHRHVGFYLGCGMAISHTDTVRAPATHYVKRYNAMPERWYWHPALDH